MRNKWISRGESIISPRPYGSNIRNGGLTPSQIHFFQAAFATVGSLSAKGFLRKNLSTLSLFMRA